MGLSSWSSTQLNVSLNVTALFQLFDITGGSATFGNLKSSLRANIMT